MRHRENGGINNEKAFNDSNVINIGSMPNCHFKINPGFDLLISLQKLENGKWKIVNNLKSDKVLFRGQPIGASIEIGSLCKLMLADSDELFAHPMHPYTKSLLSAIPLPDPHSEKNRKRIPYNALSEHDYSVDKPSLREIRPGHFVFCNDAEEKKYKEQLASEQ